MICDGCRATMRRPPDFVTLCRVCANAWNQQMMAAEGRTLPVQMHREHEGKSESVAYRQRRIARGLPARVRS